MSRKTSKNAEKAVSGRSAVKVGLLIVLGAALRYLVMSSKYQKIIANHVEISTPLSSWKRVLEGAYLFLNDIDAYEGDLLHETPLAIRFYYVMWRYVFGNVHLMFIAFDIASSVLLFFASKIYSKRFREEHKDQTKFPKDVVDCLPGDDFPNKVPVYVLLTMLFNPYSVLGCVGHSTMGIHNFFLSLFIYGMMFDSLFISTLALAICASISFYPVILILPLIIYFRKAARNSILKNTTIVTVATTMIFTLHLVLIALLNRRYDPELGFIRNVYGCILSVPDLQPNIGLFWYFFTEMFDHFRELFIYSFQINATILYLVPLSITFRNRPFILTVALLFIITIFKSYPCLSDLGFTLSLLPNFLHLCSFYQQGFVVGVILLMTTCLAPILWHLWIYSASANANFYFGVTLAYAIAQIFLVTDVLFAQTKWEFSLKRGKTTEIDGEEGMLSLE